MPPRDIESFCCQPRHRSISHVSATEFETACESHAMPKSRAVGESGRASEAEASFIGSSARRVKPPDTFTKQFAAIIRASGLADFRFHDVRHAFASISLKQGVSVKEVSALLGTAHRC